MSTNHGNHGKIKDNGPVLFKKLMRKGKERKAFDNQTKKTVK
jgi:hypothetical protein